MITIYIINLQRVIKINNTLITKVLKSVLWRAGYRNISVSLSIVNNQKIRCLNRRYLGRNRITDVIAFPLSGPSDPPEDNLIGEIVVSAEVARQEARRRHIPAQREILLYCIHGLLHLVGYDDTTSKNRAIMEKKQSEILKQWVTPLRNK